MRVTIFWIRSSSSVAKVRALTLFFAHTFGSQASLYNSGNSHTSRNDSIFFMISCLGVGIFELALVTFQNKPSFQHVIDVPGILVP